MGAQRIRNLDLFGRSVAEDELTFTHLDAVTRQRLVEAFAKEDRAGAFAILSRWGVRR